MRISFKAIRVIPFCFGCFIHHLLNRYLSTLPNHCPAQQTAGFAIYKRKDINAVFLSPMKVNSSSISASFTSSGIGAFGRLRHDPRPTAQPFDDELSGGGRSCVGSCHPHTFQWLVCADYQDSLAVWVRVCTSADSAYNDSVASLHLFCPPCFGGSSYGNMDTYSFLYFSPSFPPLP